MPSMTGMTSSPLSTSMRACARAGDNPDKGQPVIPVMPACADAADPIRWRLIVLLLRRPDRMTADLIRRLERMPVSTRRHVCADRRTA